MEFAAAVNEHRLRRTTLEPILQVYGLDSPEQAREIEKEEVRETMREELQHDLLNMQLRRDTNDSIFASPSFSLGVSDVRLESNVL